jgi:hypothetical protein
VIGQVPVPPGDNTGMTVLVAVIGALGLLAAGGFFTNLLLRKPQVESLNVDTSKDVVIIAREMMQDLRADAGAARDRAETAERHVQGLSAELSGVQRQLGDCYEEMDERVRGLQEQIDGKQDKGKGEAS